MLALLLAVAVVSAPAPAQSPSPPPPLKLIGTVHAVSPYCASFERHFNAAAAPMIENDGTIEHVNVTLAHINTLFDELNWEARFYEARLDLIKQVDVLTANNVIIQREINELRRGQTLSGDAAHVQSMHMLAQELQRAYDKQMQLATDLHGVVIAMVDYKYPKDDLGQPLPHGNIEEATIPQNGKDIKALLRWDGMRDRMYDAQRMAANWAEQVSSTYCSDSISP